MSGTDEMFDYLSAVGFASIESVTPKDEKYGVRCVGVLMEPIVPVLEASNSPTRRTAPI
jgi:hypothetical protein